jgi:ABC-2 type transport system ATP-binding protein
MSGLEGKEGRLTGELPGGWKQRLALACAVLHRPRVVFLDEPTSGVDPISRRRFWRLIDEMAASGVTVFVTTHYLDEAEYCHRLALIHAGRLVALGTVSDLKRVFAGDTVLEVTAPAVGPALELIGEQPWATETSVFGTRIHVVVRDADEGRREVERLLAAAGNPATAIERILPSLEDVFIHHVEAAEAERREQVAGARPGEAR